MPSETLINGYHLLQICGREYSETIAFSVFENDLGEGYDDSLLFGADTGNRKFALDYPTLPNYTDSRIYEISDVLYTAAEYLWELFCRQKTENTPLVIQSKLNDQYYLCKFIDKEFTLQKALVALFSGKAVFRQVRQSGVSVFDPTELTLWGLYDVADFNTIDKILADSSGNNHDFSRLAGGTDYVKDASGLNGQTTLRFNSGAGSSYLGLTGASVTIKEVFAVMKINEATFSGNLGIVSGGASDTNGILIGNNATTKFYDLNYDAGQVYFYSKNNTEFAESDAQAPMNTFALLYIRAETGIALTDIFLGKDRNLANYGKFELAKLALGTSFLPASQRKEFVEHLVTKYGL